MIYFHSSLPVNYINGFNSRSWQTFAFKVPPTGLSNPAHPSQLRLPRCGANVLSPPENNIWRGCHSTQTHEHLYRKQKQAQMHGLPAGRGTGGTGDRSSFETSTFPLCLHVGDVVCASRFISSAFSSLGTLLGLVLQAQVHFETPSSFCRYGHLSHNPPALVYVKGMEQGRGRRYVTGR